MQPKARGFGSSGDGFEDSAVPLGLGSSLSEQANAARGLLRKDFTASEVDVSVLERRIAAAADADKGNKDRDKGSLVRALVEYVNECVARRHGDMVAPLMSSKRLGPWRVVRWDKAEMVAPAVLLFECLAAVAFDNPKRSRGYAAARAALDQQVK